MIHYLKIGKSYTLLNSSKCVYTITYHSNKPETFVTPNQILWDTGTVSINSPPKNQDKWDFYLYLLQYTLPNPWT